MFERNSHSKSFGPKDAEKEKDAPSKMLTISSLRRCVLRGKLTEQAEKNLFLHPKKKPEDVLVKPDMHSGPFGPR